VGHAISDLKFGNRFRTIALERRHPTSWKKPPLQHDPQQDFDGCHLTLCLSN